MPSRRLLSDCPPAEEKVVLVGIEIRPMMVMLVVRR
jgi:hypothetical protein